jgi:sugar phosphate isomerase/epimerase
MMTSPLEILIACQGDGWGYIPALARKHHAGIEVGDFGDANLIEGAWKERLQEILPLLNQVPGERTLHGPRSEINPGLRDRGLVEFARRRYQQALEIAVELGANSIVYHTGFNPLIRAPGYERRWIRRSATFWRDLGEEAGQLGLQIVLENVWEPHPEILRDLIDAVDSPNVRACFDVGHANVYSKQRPEKWLSSLGSRVSYVHLHNNDGRLDNHRPLEEGTVDFAQFLPLMTIDPQPPRLVLEVSSGRRKLEDSLFYMRRLLGLV